MHILGPLVVRGAINWDILGNIAGASFAVTLTLAVDMSALVGDCWVLKGSFGPVSLYGKHLKSERCSRNEK
jgi:hypothetical protein